MRSIRDLSSLIIAMSLLQGAAGILSVILPLSMDAVDIAETEIGLVVAAYATGFLLGGVFAPRLIARMGSIRAYSAFAAATAALTLALFWRIDAPTWAVLRAMQGFCFVGLFTVAESWLAVAAPPENRGSLLGVYHVATKIALLGGPFLILGAAPLTAGPFMAAAGIIALALIPLCLTRQMEPARPPRDPFPMSRLWRIAPAAAASSFAAGVLNAGLLALLPVYAAELPGEAVTAAAVLQAAAWTGGILSQWPAGKISDSIDRRIVVAALSIVGGLGSGGLAYFGAEAPLWAALLLIGTWGAGGLSFYGVAVAHATDLIETKDIAKAMAGLLMIYGLGAILGPVLFGAMMQLYGSTGLFATNAAGSLLLAGAVFIRARTHAVPDDVEKEPYEYVPATSSAAIANADPRAAPAE